MEKNNRTLEISRVPGFVHYSNSAPSCQNLTELIKVLLAICLVFISIT